MKKKTYWMILCISICALLLSVLFSPQLLGIRNRIGDGWKTLFPPMKKISRQFAHYPPMTHPEQAWYQTTNLIYHAGGEIDAVAYTNSREALQSTLDRGNFTVEMDFLFTSDGHLICAHKWADLYALEPITLEQFREVNIYRKYTIAIF